ncbi:hypothetical protein BJ508DRAFT_410300 [Ascobolus immersus RN42]|uniref:DUF7918 domain-containing protein n=1 Tax=Ascobolus immersus RN42 TaxID=1160509 RepID=A0A3N4IN32_ASCIM|nr:hypothetical protein BJ508DRAFT_410300 [Ascobolus immersus RN42]
MVRIGPFEFKITDNDLNPLPEYPYTDESASANPTRSASCYVQTPSPSEDQRFCITIDPVNPPLEYGFSDPKGYAFTPTYDGKKDAFDWDIKAPWYCEDPIDSQGLIIDSFSELPPRARRRYVEKELVFKPIETYEEQDESGMSEEEKKKLGCIEIEFAEINCFWEDEMSKEDLKRIKANEKYFGPKPKGGKLSGGKVHEKDVKGKSVSHSVGTGREKDSFSASDAIGYDVEPASRKYVRFYYRSKRALQGLGVVPADDASTTNEAPMQKPPTPAVRTEDSNHEERRNGTGSPPTAHSSGKKRKQSESASSIASKGSSGSSRKKRHVAEE